MIDSLLIAAHAFASCVYRWTKGESEGIKIWSTNLSFLSFVFEWKVCWKMKNTKSFLVSKDDISKRADVSLINTVKSQAV